MQLKFIPFIRIITLLFLLLTSVEVYGAESDDLVGAEAAASAVLSAKEAPVLLEESTDLVKENNISDSSKKHLWNLQNADINAVIAAIAKETGKNFLVDPKVQGNITIVSSKPMNGDEAYQVFLSALEVLGYAAVPSDNVIKIVPNVTAKSMNAPLATETQPGVGDELVVRVVFIHSVSASELVAVLRPLMPEWSTISAYSPTNSLILAGRASNIERISQIIQRIDQANNNSIEIIPLHQSSASKLVNVLTGLQNADRAVGKLSKISLAADDQSNSILMSGDVQDRLSMRAVIAELDTPRNSAAAMNTKVFRLNYLKAKDLAGILTKVVQGSFNEESNKQGGIVSTNLAAGSDKKISIQAEPESNAVVVSAPPHAIRTIAAVIKQLDIKPEEVLVEAIIARVDETVANQLGILWSYGTVIRPEDRKFQGGVGIISSGEFHAVVNALSSGTAADILSTPSVVVMNNQEALIADGTEVSVEQSEQSTLPGVGAPFATFSQRKVVLSLKVTPQISPGNVIRLKIDQTNDSLRNPDNPGIRPIINTSQIKTSVMVHSGDILVLGGLIKHNSVKSVQKTPILGDIPGIGQLFRKDDKNSEKNDLMVFIRPIVLKDQAQNRSITNKRYNMIRRDQLARARGENILRNTAPVLKPWYQTKQAELPHPFPRQRRHGKKER